jgi:hypothetical protein
MELEVTWGRAIRIWWSLIWRGVLYGGIAGLVAGFITVEIGIALPGPQGPMDTWATVARVVVGISVGMWVVKRVMKLRYSRFRVALLSIDSE